MEKVKGSRGRPSKGEDAKRHAVGIRTTKELKSAIEESAAATGRSMAQEIEYRLEASFREEATLGGRRTAALARTLAALIGQIEEGAGGRWYENQACWAAVSNMLPRVMHAFMPDPENADELINEAIAKILADRAVEAFNEQQGA